MRSFSLAQNIGTSAPSAVKVAACMLPLFIGALNVPAIAPRQNTKSSYESRTISNTATSSFRIIAHVSNFENGIAEFYQNFISSQEILDNDFAVILENNRWDLYE